MTAEFTFQETRFSADLQTPLDLSIPIVAGHGRLSAWYVEPVRIEPVRTDQFIGAVAEGGSVNFNDISFNPHGHCTHTECLGHITPQVHSVNRALNNFFFPALLISVTPYRVDAETPDAAVGDLVIGPSMIPDGALPPALIIRTRPNTDEKRTRAHSNTNPPYLSPEAVLKVVSGGVEHLLVDLPSIDREVDEGRLLGHHLFWGLPDHPRVSATITELIYAPDHIRDGFYLLNLQCAPFENDATPSRPVLYPVSKR